MAVPLYNIIQQQPHARNLSLGFIDSIISPVQSSQSCDGLVELVDGRFVLFFQSHSLSLSISTYGCILLCIMYYDYYCDNLYVICGGGEDEDDYIRRQLRLGLSSVDTLNHHHHHLNERRN